MNISNCSLKDECQFVKELKNKISNMKESYETDAEAKFYDYVDKYNSKKLLTANDYVELNKNNEILMIYNQTLLKENQELKKQLEEYKEQVHKGLYNVCLPYQTGYNKAIKDKETQQKEFIKYLEEEIKTLEKDILDTVDDMDIYMKQVKSLIIEQILQKHKEIIGVSNDY